jgi:hypothetical protein
LIRAKVGIVTVGRAREWSGERSLFATTRGWSP